ncbi:MAG: hypothetical protein V1721_00590 [Pseudomonadota bacterium]
MSRFDNINTKVIRTVTILVVLGGGGVFFPESSAVGASPGAPAPFSLTSPQPSAPPAGALDEDSLSWGSETSPPVPSSASPVPADTASLPLPTPSVAGAGIKPAAVVPAREETVKKTDDEVPDNMGAVEAPSENTPAFLARIESLERRIGTLEEDVGKLRQSKAAGENVSGNDVRVKKASRAKKVKRDVKTSRKAPEWVLKAARPGMAWVSERGSSELRAVTAGEILEGIGKINAIVKDSSGYWVVDGVSGRISQ